MTCQMEEMSLSTRKYLHPNLPTGAKALKP